MCNQRLNEGTRKAPFLRITLSFMSGIYLGQYLPLDYYSYVASLLLLLVVIYMCSFILWRKKSALQANTCLVLMPFICFCLAGTLHMIQQNPHIQSRHIINMKGRCTAYKGIVDSDIVVKSRYKEVILRITHIARDNQWQKAVGKVHLLFPSKKVKKLMYGDYLLIQGQPRLLASPTNPQEVNYNQQWRIKHIFHEHTPSSYLIIGHQPRSLIVKQTLRFRDYCATQLQHHIKDKKAIGITLALLLGIRSHLSKETRYIYTISGVMHILAVSGLHVGLLYTLLLYILYFLSALFFRKKQQYPLVTLFFIWIYAFIVQLTPAVLRAVSLLSLIVIARKQQKSYYTINLLSLIAFVLLCCNPYWLLDIGFQLSFLAVTSLTLLYQPLHKLYSPTYKPVAYLWSITTGSFAVQIGTLPISLYYFQYFPTYFLLANYIMLPLAAPILLLAITSLGFSWLPSAAALLALLLSYILSSTTFLLTQLIRLPYAHLGPFQLNLSQITCYYATLLSYYLVIKQRRFRYVFITSILITTLSGLTFYPYIQQKKQKKIIIYDLDKKYVISLITGQQATLLSNKTLQPYESLYRYKVQPSLHHLGIRYITQQNTQTIKKTLLYHWQGKSILIIDKKHPPPDVMPPHIDILIIQEDASIDMVGLHSQIGIVIIGATNAHPDRLAQCAAQHHLPYYSIPEKGAYITQVR